MNRKRELGKIELLKLKGYSCGMKPGIPQPKLHSTLSWTEKSTNWWMTCGEIIRLVRLLKLKSGLPSLRTFWLWSVVFNRQQISHYIGKHILAILVFLYILCRDGFIWVHIRLKNEYVPLNFKVYTVRTGLDYRVTDEALLAETT